MGNIAKREERGLWSQNWVHTWLCQMWAVWPWVCWFTSISLRFLIYKVRITLLTSKGEQEDFTRSTQKWPVLGLAHNICRIHDEHSFYDYHNFSVFLSSVKCNHTEDRHKWLADFSPTIWELCNLGHITYPLSPYRQTWSLWGSSEITCFVT